MPSKSTQVSVFRLRLGIVLFFLFWLPAYLLAPVVAVAFGDQADVVQLTIFIMIIQTVIGLAGFVVAGKEVIQLLKHTPRKQILKTVWHIFWSGSTQ